MPALPVALVAWGAANPPKTNKAVQEAAAADKIFLETRIRTRMETKAKTEAETETNVPTLTVS